jgi:hypothetical protein
MNEAVSEKLMRFEWQFGESRWVGRGAERAVCEALGRKMERQMKSERALLLLGEGFGHTSGRAARRRQSEGVRMVGMWSIMRYREPESESGHEAERS